jgi:hypothetical protein
MEDAMKGLILSAIALAACSAAYAQPEKPARQCFSTRQIDRSVVVDDSTINFKVGRQVYQMKMAGACPRLKNNVGGYIMNLKGSDQICEPLDVQIIVNDNIGSFCNSKSLRRLTPDEISARPKKDAP